MKGPGRPGAPRPNPASRCPTLTHPPSPCPPARSYASVFQMLRGTLVIFAGLLTIVLLKRSLYIHHWMGMVLITAGAALVGASSVIYSGGGRGGPEEGGEGNVRWWGLLQVRGGWGGGGDGAVVGWLRGGGGWGLCREGSVDVRCSLGACPPTHM